MMVARREAWAQDQSLRLYRNGIGELEAEKNRETIGKVRLVLTFPVTKPEGYISVRSALDQEVHFILSLDELDKKSQSAAREELQRSYLIPEILKIMGIKRRGRNWLWEVETTYGRISFRIDQPQESIDFLSENDYTIKDTEGRRYVLRDITRLDKQSKLYWNKIN